MPEFSRCAGPGTHPNRTPFRFGKSTEIIFACARCQAKFRRVKAMVNAGASRDDVSAYLRACDGVRAATA